MGGVDLGCCYFLLFVSCVFFVYIFTVIVHVVFGGWGMFAGGL